MQVNSGIALSNTILYLNVPNNGTTGLTNLTTDTAWVFGGLAGAYTLRLTNAVGVQVTSLTLGSSVPFTNAYAGALSGLSALTKNGINAQIISSNDASSPETITVNGGVLLYGGTNQIGGSGANLTVNSGASFGVLGFAADQNLLNRIAGGSGVLALDANTPNNLNFSAPALANLSLGAYSPGTSWWYIGTSLTPGSGGYHLGGGGGVLNISNINVLAGNNNVWIGAGGSAGTVFLGQNQNYTGQTIISNGTLSIAFNAPNGASTGVITLVNGTLILGGNGTTNQVTPIGNNCTLTFNGGSFTRHRQHPYQCHDQLHGHWQSRLGACGGERDELFPRHDSCPERGQHWKEQFRILDEHDLGPRNQWVYPSVPRCG